MRGPTLAAVLVLVFLVGAAFAGQEEETDTLKTVPKEDAAAKKLDMKVREIFGRSCASSLCHGGEHPKMGLSLEPEAIPGNMIGVSSGQNAELMLIDTKDPSRSYLLLKITGGDGIKGKKMPIMRAPLKEDELISVMTWVRGFAEEAEESEKDKDALKDKNEETDDEGERDDKGEKDNDG
jgi:hypothetical protein